MPASRPQPPHRYVYVIGPIAGLPKIGLATDLRPRRATLQTASPTPLVMHVAVRVPFGEAHAVKRRMHQSLTGYRATGELFDVTPGVAVATVREAAGAGGPMPLEPALGPLFAYSGPAQAIPQPGRQSRGLGWRQFCGALIGYSRMVSR